MKSVSEEGTVWSLGKNPLTSKVKVRFELGSKNGSTTAATKARFLAGSWSADSGDEMPRNVKPSRGPSLASMEIRTTPWVLFSALREEKILRRKRGARNIMHVLYPD